MHKARPRYNYQAIMGYAPVDAKVEIDVTPETIDEAVRMAIQEAQSPRLKHWYRTGQGQYWVKYGLGKD